MTCLYGGILAFCHVLPLITLPGPLSIISTQNQCTSERA
ncbi:hypothetical protein GLYMA_19G064950v4 [Glycine max]|nr:hypothetical protein GLYMA_19G064950v4 [Glycine max]KAH1076663.1 hypothetical protein GYH30_052258 [Glycine max]